MHLLQLTLDFFRIMYIIILMNRSEGRVWAEIYLDRLIKNYYQIKKKVGKARIMAAIKADAYGHGAREVGRTLEAEGIEMFGVASIEEGVELREGGIQTPILILSPILYSQIDTLLEYDLMPTISELSFYNHLERKLRKLRRPIKIHIEVDTGMTRTGFSYNKIKQAIHKIGKSRFIKIEGFFSHFPVADADGSFTKKQIEDFKGLLKQMHNLRVRPRYVHLANSAGIFKYPRAYFNLVRPGIALYGLRPSPSIDFGKNFAPVLALKSRVVNVRQVGPQTPISYGHRFITKRRSRIATVSVGYGDGYPRVLSNRGEVLIRGTRARIVGTVCMDLIMIDVTHIHGVRVGDIVTLIGQDGKDEISAEECARWANTIVYEITSGIGPRVARVYKIKGRTIEIRNLLGRWRNA